MRDSLIVYTAYADKFCSLTDEQFGKLLRMMIEYQTSGEVPEVDDVVIKLSFDVVKVDMDKNNEKYDRVVQRNRENGKNGGRPKNPVGYLGTQQNPREPKKADNDNDNDNDNVTFKKSNKIIKAFSDSPEVNQAIKDFIEHRKKLKKPMSDRAIELFIQRLNKMTGDKNKQIELINTAILKGWMTVYPSDKPEIEEKKNTSKLKALENYYLGGAN